MEKIIVRDKLIKHAHISSSFIWLCAEKGYNSSEDYLKKFGIAKMMKDFFCEEIFSDNLTDSHLYKQYIIALESKMDNELFVIAYKLDDEFAVHLTENIYLYRLVPKNEDRIYASVIPWYYADSKRYYGDTWWEEDSEILRNFKSLTIIDFLKRYKGY